MTSLNNQYSSRKFSPTKSHTPCPICDDIKGKCRIASDNQDFVLRMTHPSDVGLSDWKIWARLMAATLRVSMSANVLSLTQSAKSVMLAI